ncbi:MAG: radical SAM protein [Bacteroidaceae bacterium]|nr:radical SAM protein [Bacteroidaceae bacterium]
MLLRQSKNSFIRCTEHYGFITNQLTGQDRTYDEFGADLLRMIMREPQEIGDIVAHLLDYYEGVDSDTLYNDFMEFIEPLVKDSFVVMGDTAEELDSLDLEFDYDKKVNVSSSNAAFSPSEEEPSDEPHDYYLEDVRAQKLMPNIQLELSSRCNERCIHCYIPDGKKQHGFEIPTQRVKDIIDQFREMGGLHVTLSGGEVFLHKDLMDIVAYCREKDLEISIFSNLISLKDSQIPVLKEANILLIQTSLYSMNPTIHDAITKVKGSWSKTMTAIEKLVGANIPLQISCPIMTANYDSYRGVFEYATARNIAIQSYFSLIARADLDTDNLSYQIPLHKIASIIEDFKKYNVDIYNERKKGTSRLQRYDIDPKRFKEEAICGVGYDKCCVAANGNVYPCAGWQGFVLGNVFRQSLTEIWRQSPKLEELRGVKQKDFPKCLNCMARDYCYMCLVRNYNENEGDMYKVSPHFCDAIFLTKKIMEDRIVLANHFKKEYDGLWEDYKGLPLTENGYDIVDHLYKDTMLFVGLNPAMDRSDKTRSRTFGDLKADAYPYFRTITSIANSVGIPLYSYLDLLGIRNNSQTIIRGNVDKDSKAKGFCEKQVDIAVRAMRMAKPKVIVVCNAFARDLLNGHDGFKTVFDDKIGTDVVVCRNELEGTPVFFTSMLSGRHSLDVGSRKRLIWHIKQVL